MDIAKQSHKHRCICVYNVYIYCIYCNTTYHKWTDIENVRYMWNANSIITRSDHALKCQVTRQAPCSAMTEHLPSRTSNYEIYLDKFSLVDSSVQRSCQTLVTWPNSLAIPNLCLWSRTNVGPHCRSRTEAAELYPIFCQGCFSIPLPNGCRP